MISSSLKAMVGNKRSEYVGKKFRNLFWDVFNLLTFFGMTDLGAGFDGPYVRKF